MKSEKSVEISALVTTTRERLQELRYSSSCSCGAFDKAIDLFESAVIAKALDAVSAGLEKVGQS